MALLDAKFVPLAKRLLDKYGMTASLRVRDSSISFDEQTGTRSKSADTTFSVKAVPPSVSKDLIRDGSNETSAVTFISPIDIEGNDLCSGNEPVKNCDTFIASDGKPYKIAKKTSIYSGDLVALIRLDLE